MAHTLWANPIAMSGTKTVPEMRFPFGLSSDRAILLEPVFSKASSQITELSLAKGLSAGTYLIHRTGGSEYQAILESGFKIHFSFVTDTAHTTRQLGPDFEDLLAAKFHYHCSTHHVIMYVPDKALEQLDRVLLDKGDFPLRSEHAISFFTQALDGTIPKQYVLGVFEYDARRFIPNTDFDPKYLPESFPSLKDIEIRERSPGQSQSGGAVFGYAPIRYGEFAYVFAKQSEIG
jgi:hypothetical protein